MAVPSPPRQTSFASRSFLPLALITLGVVLLLGNLVPEPGRGGLILLGLGAAFVIGRLTTGRYGYAVPGGILLAIGTYVILTRVLAATTLQNGGWFFTLLGLGFVVTYLVGMRPAAVWPLFPAALLIALGLVLFGFSRLAPLASLAWIVGYWPVALILVGLWLLVHDHLPATVRRPLATIGGLALLGYGVLAAMAGVAAGGALARGGVAPSFGPSPFADTVTLSAPLAAGQTLTVANSAGRSVVRAGDGDSVHVTATRHFSPAGSGPDVRLVPDGAGLRLDASQVGGFWPFGNASWVDYEVDVPASANVQIESASGPVELDDVAGSVQAKTASGSIVANNASGEVQLSTSSGQIQATGLRHLRQVSTASGSIAVEGVFTEPARINSSSGRVAVRLQPGSAVALDVHTGSGSINTSGLPLTSSSQQRNSLSGSLGTPAPGATLSIQTSSGSVQLSP